MKPKIFLPIIIALTSVGFAKEKEAVKLIDPKAKAVLEKSIEALGSKEALAKIKSRYAVGTLEIPAQGMSMTLEIKQKNSEMYHMKAVIPNVVTSEQGYDGKEGWAKDNIQGSRKLAGAELAQAKESTALFPEQQILKELVEATILPDSKEGEQTFTVIKTKDKNSEKTLYFDQNTHLLKRIVTKVVTGPDGEMETDSQISDYQEVDSVQIPHIITSTVGPIQMVIKLTKIEHNKEISDDIFKMKK